MNGGAREGPLVFRDAVEAARRFEELKSQGERATLERRREGWVIERLGPADE